MKTKSKNKKLRIALGICIPLIIIIAAALAVVMKYGPTFGFYLVPPSAELSLIHISEPTRRS